MRNMLFVGLDVGTKTSKAVVFTEDGDTVASGRADTPWTFTPTGAELDAGALLTAAKAAVSEALSDCPSGEIAGVGVTSLAEAGVLLDSRGEPVAPIIAWHDTRDHAEFDHLRRAISAQDFSATTGLPLRQQWSLTKHRWLMDNVPAARRAVRRLNVAEWIVRGLGGEEATEQSLASRTGWLRLAQHSWWSETLEWAGASEDLMPPLVTAGTPLGRVGADTGMPRLAGAVLTLAGHDHQAAVIGAAPTGLVTNWIHAARPKLWYAQSRLACLRWSSPNLRRPESLLAGMPLLITGACLELPREAWRCNGFWHYLARTRRTYPPLMRRPSHSPALRCEWPRRHSADWTSSESPMEMAQLICGEQLWKPSPIRPPRFTTR